MNENTATLFGFLGGSLAAICALFLMVGCIKHENGVPIVQMRDCLNRNGSWVISRSSNAGLNTFECHMPGYSRTYTKND